MNAETAILAAKELINVGPPDLLLLGLVGFFFFSGMGYKIKSGAEVVKVRGVVAKLVSSVDELTAKQKALRDDLHNLLNSQNVNMSEINRLKQRKFEIGKMPIGMSKELEDIVMWCHSKHISVNFERRMAAKRPSPKGNRL